MPRAPKIITLALAFSYSVAAAETSSTPCRSDAPHWVEKLAAKKRIPGIAAAVSVDDQIVWSFGSGTANLEQGTPVLPEGSRFRIGSTSKTLTAFALMRLVDAGKLDLDAPIQDFLPEVQANLEGVTLRRLAGHLAGIRHYNSRSELASQVEYPTVTSSLDVFINDPLIAEPGESFNYSTFGYTLISAAIESVSKEDFLTVMSRSVFEPIGMSHTVPDDTREIIPNRTGFYYLDDSRFRNGPEINSSYKWAGGGFLSSAVDLVQFGMAHFDTQMLSEASRKALWTSQHDGSDAETGYGIGWFVGKEWVQHPGGAMGGSALLRIYPESRVVIALLANLSMIGDQRFDDLPDRLKICFAK